jgi:hypothetical protein
MPASYPSSAKTFTTKSNNTTADASHINDVQLEITAIEQDLLSGSAVSRGGTGATTLTDRGVLVGRGTSAIEATAAGASGEALMGAGASTNPSFQRIMRVLNRSAADVTSSGTGETDLKTYSLPAGTLSTNGDSVRVTVTGSAIGDTNSKTVRLYFGATVVLTYPITGADDTAWRMWAEITRTGATAQIACGQFDTVGSGAGFTTSAPAETLANAITIKMTGQAAVGASSVTAKNFSVEFLPNA